MTSIPSSINIQQETINQTAVAMPTVKDVNDFRYHRYLNAYYIFKFIFSLNLNTLRLDRERNQFSNLQFKQKEPPIPIKQILIALFMFLTGSIMIIIGVLLFTGHINAKVKKISFIT